MRARRARAAALALTALAACGGGQGDRPAGDAPAADTSAVAQARDSAVRAQLERYLEQMSVTGTSDVASLEAVFDCSNQQQVLPVHALARWRVLDVTVRGDSADAAVEVLTLAEQNRSPANPRRWVATLRPATDTLHYTLGRPAPTSGWKVCGLPKEGVDFGQYGADAETDWTPRGASWDRVRAMADSIRRAAS
jgi:hypothetical protein